MRNFKRFVAFVLCAVMLVGLVPVAFENAKVVAVSDEDGIVQGENDLVIRMMQEFNPELAECHLLPAYIFENVGKKYENCGLAEIEDLADFERIIIVFAKDTTLPIQNSAAWGNHVKLYANVLSGAQTVILTQKCRVDYPEKAWDCVAGDFANKSSARTKAKYTKSDVAEGTVWNYYDNTENPGLNVTVSLPTEAKFADYTDAGVARRTVNTISFVFGSSMVWDYLRMDFTSKNPLVYCQGFDFTVGENVDFSYTTALGKDDLEHIKYPIILNGSYETTSYYEKNKTAVGKDEQTITVLGGDWQYIAPRIRAVNTEHTSTGKTTNIVLGAATFHKEFVDNDPNQSAFLSFENYDSCTVNVTIDGATFNGPLFIIGARQNSTNAAQAPSIKDTVVNLHIKSGTFNGGISPKLGEYLNSVTGIPTTRPYPTENISGLAINVKVDSIDLGQDTTFSVEADEDRGVGVISSVVFTGKEFIKENTYDRSCTEGTHKCKNVMDGDEFSYYGCQACGAIISSSPVIFCNQYKGNEANDGLTAETAVKQFSTAYAKLAIYGIGGTIVLSGECYPSQVDAPDVGGDVTITSVFNGVDYRSSANACIVFVGSLKIKNPTTIKCLDIMHTGSPKIWYLNFHDLTVDQSVRNYLNSGSYSDETPPVKNGAQTDPRIDIVAGAFRTNANNIDHKNPAYGNRAFGVQNIVLAGGLFRQVVAGNRSVATELAKVANIGAAPLNPVSGETPSGVTNIYICGAKLLAAEVHQMGNVETNLFLDSSVTFKYHAYNASGSFAKTTIDGYSSKNLYVLMTADELAKAEEIVHVIDDGVFGKVSYQEKKDGETLLGGRVSYTTGTDFATWCDDADSNNDTTSPVVEFGVLMSTKANAGKIAYVSNTNANGVGKSICFDENHKDYLYAGGEAAVTFRGNILCTNENGDDLSEQYKANIFAAAPYAVVNGESNVGGKYTVIGDVDVFTYEGIQ